MSEIALRNNSHLFYPRRDPAKDLLLQIVYNPGMGVESPQRSYGRPGPLPRQGSPQRKFAFYSVSCSLPHPLSLAVAVVAIFAGVGVITLPAIVMSQIIVVVVAVIVITTRYPPCGS